MSSKLIFSNLTWSNDGGISWGKSIGEQFGKPVFIEWNVNRIGISGNLADHPSIENVDQWRLQGEASGVLPYSIHLPLKFTPDVDQVGSEISAADGWTDLASYINAPLIRIEFTQDCDFQSIESHKALRSIVQYMLEMDRFVSVQLSSDLQNVLHVVLDGIGPELLDKFGEHIFIDTSGNRASESQLPLISTEIKSEILDSKQHQKQFEDQTSRSLFTIVRIS